MTLNISRIIDVEPIIEFKRRILDAQKKLTKSFMPLEMIIQKRHDDKDYQEKKEKEDIEEREALEKAEEEKALKDGKGGEEEKKLSPGEREL